ncbi:armadillo-type protein [Mycena olivaceomarginata]|nr:armadillo-type protein [Mycena olivaceomarginata]
MKATLNFLLSLSSLSQHGEIYVKPPHTRIHPAEDEFWAEIPRPELINRIIPVLEEVNPYARYAALKALQALIKHSIVTSQLATKLIARAGDSYGFVGQTALQEIKALASRDDFRSAIMTPEAQDQITSMLKDTLWFVHTAVLRALTSLASHGQYASSCNRYPDRSPDAVGVAIATPAIIAEVLPGLENADDIVRETTIDFVASLSEYDTIQAQLANFKEKLFFMLGDIYINVRQAAMKALKILSKIDGLSDDIPGLVNKLSTSLKGGPSQRQIGLQVFGEFAQIYWRRNRSIWNVCKHRSRSTRRRWLWQRLCQKRKRSVPSSN